MILIDNIKYSCIECIRGHRSSLCRHHTRPLLQVRSKGRPNVSANGNPNHRIAVFAEEIELDAEKSSEGGCEGGHGATVAKTSTKKCNSKSSPVVILKCSTKQVIDLESGQIIGPYEGVAASDAERKLAITEGATSIKPSASVNLGTEEKGNRSCCSSKKQFAPVIPSVEKSGCCGPKAKSKCSCSNKGKTINKSKILKTYLQNHLMKLKDWSLSEKMLLNEYSQLRNQDHPMKKEFQEEEQFQALFFQDQRQRGPVKLEQLEDELYKQSSGYVNTQDPLFPLLSAIQPQLQFQTQRIPNTYPYNNAVKTENINMNSIPIHESGPQRGSNDFVNSQTPTQGAVYDVVSVPACSIPGTCCCGDTCSCEGCEVHGNPLRSISSELDTLPPMQHHQVVLTTDPVKQETQQYNLTDLFNFRDVEQQVGDSPSSAATCSCPNDDCDCANCETHGIINGMKLDDYFDELKSQYSNNIQSLSQLYTRQPQQQYLHQQEQQLQPQLQHPQLQPQPQQQQQPLQEEIPVYHSNSSLYSSRLNEDSNEKYLPNLEAQAQPYDYAATVRNMLKKDLAHTNGNIELVGNKHYPM